MLRTIENHPIPYWLVPQNLWIILGFGILWLLGCFSLKAIQKPYNPLNVHCCLLESVASARFQQSTAELGDTVTNWIGSRLTSWTSTTLFLAVFYGFSILKQAHDQNWWSSQIINTGSVVFKNTLDWSDVFFTRYPIITGSFQTSSSQFQAYQLDHDPNDPNVANVGVWGKIMAADSWQLTTRLVTWPGPKVNGSICGYLVALQAACASTTETHLRPS